MFTTIHTQMHRATDLAKVCRPGMDRAIETSHNPSALAKGIALPKNTKGGRGSRKNQDIQFYANPVLRKEAGFFVSLNRSTSIPSRAAESGQPHHPPPEIYPNAKRTRPRRPPEPGPDERDPGRSRDRGMPADKSSLSANPRPVKPDEAKPFRPVQAPTMSSSFSNYRYLPSHAFYPLISILAKTRGFPREVCL
jgi:hypothetical protein